MRRPRTLARSIIVAGAFISWIAPVFALNVQIVGGTDDFGYSKMIEDFSWNQAPTPTMAGGVTELSNNNDGSGTFGISASASDPRIHFYNDTYQFEATAYPYLRMNYRSSADKRVDFWPSPANTTNRSYFTSIAAPDYTEVSHRFLHLARTMNTLLDGNGFRLDPVSQNTGSPETFELDYVIVDSFPTLGLGEFSRNAHEWTGSNLDHVAVSNLSVLAGTAGSTNNRRSISRSITITNRLYTALEIRLMREAGSKGAIQVSWNTESNGWFSAEWIPESDGKYYSYLVDFVKCPEWRENTTTEIRIDLFDFSEPNSGKVFGIDFIRLRRLPELGMGQIHNNMTTGYLFRRIFDSQHDYVLSKLRYYRSAAGQATNEGWQNSTAAASFRHDAHPTIDGRQPWWKEDITVDTDGDGTNDFEWVVRGTNGLPDPEMAAEKFFQHIKGISANYNALDPASNKPLFSIYPDSAMGTLIFGNQKTAWPLRGGFYETVGGNTNVFDESYLPAAQDMAVDCYIRMMRKLKDDPETSHLKVYFYHALRGIDWDDLPRTTTHAGYAGNLREMIDKLLVRDAEEFPDGDSPLIGFSQDLPWEFYKKTVPNGQKLLEYMEYVQERGYRFTLGSNGAHPTVDNPVRKGYEAMWRQLRRVIQEGGRPDEVHAYHWASLFDGDFETTMLDEHEDSDFSYAAGLRRTLDQISYGLPPARPTEVLAVFNGNDVIVSWDDNQEYDLLGYEVQRAPNRSGPFTTLSPLVTDNSYTDTTTTSNGIYYYRVIAELEDSDTSVRSAGLPSLPAKAVRNSSYVVLDDDFDDQSNPGWLTHGPAPVFVPEADGHALQVVYSGSADGAMWLRHFNPVELNEGDALTIEWQMKQTLFDPSTTYMRIGLANSGGQHITNNAVYLSAKYHDYDGYMFDFKDSTDFTFPWAHGRLLRRTNPDTILSSKGEYSERDAMFDMMGMETNEWTPTQRITFERKSDGYFVETVFGGVAGTTNNAITTAYDTTETDVLDSFDTFFIFQKGGVSTSEYLIDNISITLRTRAYDGDLPAEWKNQYGITSQDGNNDSDPFTNFEEWLAGTDPTDSASFFHITESSDHISSVEGIADRSYILMAATNLTESFVPVSTNTTEAGFSGSVSLTDTVYSAESPVFYKIKVTSP